MPTFCSDNNAFRINEKPEYSNGMDAGFWVLGIVLGTGCWFLSTAYSTGRSFLDKIDQSFAPAPSCLTMH